MKRNALCCIFFIAFVSACSSVSLGPKNIMSMNDEELKKAFVGFDFVLIKKKYGLDKFPDHVTPQGNPYDNDYMYDFGDRWFFLTIDLQTDRVENAYFGRK